MATQSQEQLSKCEICEETFENEELVGSHLKSHDTSICLICKEVFSQRNDLRIHLKTHFPLPLYVSEYSCPFCSQTYKKIDNLTDHLIGHKEPQGPYKCLICYKSFKLEPDLTEHIRTDHECTICKKSFQQKSNLTNHLKSHSAKKSHYAKARFKCSLCNESFKHLSSFTGHIKTHAPKAPLKCSFCHQVFRNKTTLNIHIRIHSDSVNSYKQMKSLERDSLSGGRYSCTFCGKHFAAQNYLTSHLKKVCRTYKCSICHKGIQWEDRDTYEHPYACAVCRKYFSHCINPSSATVAASMCSYKCSVCSKPLIFRSGAAEYLKADIKGQLYSYAMSEKSHDQSEQPSSSVTTCKSVTTAQSPMANLRYSKYIPSGCDGSISTTASNMTEEEDMSLVNATGNYSNSPSLHSLEFPFIYNIKTED